MTYAGDLIARHSLIYPRLACRFPMPIPGLRKDRCKLHYGHVLYARQLIKTSSVRKLETRDNARQVSTGQM
jgi:hypothetical protein